jgi:hypothetical protein
MLSLRRGKSGRNCTCGKRFRKFALLPTACSRRRRASANDWRRIWRSRILRAGHCSLRLSLDVARPGRDEAESFATLDIVFTFSVLGHGMRSQRSYSARVPPPAIAPAEAKRDFSLARASSKGWRQPRVWLIPARGRAVRLQPLGGPPRAAVALRSPTDELESDVPNRREQSEE